MEKEIRDFFAQDLLFFNVVSLFRRFIPKNHIHLFIHNRNRIIFRRQHRLQIKVMRICHFPRPFRLNVDESDCKQVLTLFTILLIIFYTLTRLSANEIASRQMKTT